VLTQEPISPTSRLYRMSDKLSNLINLMATLTNAGIAGIQWLRSSLNTCLIL